MCMCNAPKYPLCGICKSPMVIHMPTAAAARSLQSCLTLRPHRRQPTRLPVPGIPQAGTLEWVAISFSNAWKWKMKVKALSRVRFLATPGTAAHQAPPSMGFSRQEYRSGLPLPSPICILVQYNQSKHKKQLNGLIPCLSNLTMKPFSYVIYPLLTYWLITSFHRNTDEQKLKGSRI